MVRYSRISLALAAVLAVAGACHVWQRASAQTEQPSEQPAIKLLGRMIGGYWETEGKFKARFTYQWRVPGKAIHASGKGAIGTKDEFPMDAMYGWDAAAKKVYYFDFHSNDTIYKGLVQAEGNTMTGEFEGYVGDTGKYRFEDTLTDNDTLQAKMFAKNKQGEWKQIHEMTFKRHR